ncbi:MAG: MltA domain-containing protein, partial [Kiloniellales bacterium]
MATGPSPDISRDRRLTAPWPSALALFAAGLLLLACEKKPPPGELPDRLVLTPVSYTALPGWPADSQSEALPALARSCARLESQPDDRPLGPGGLAGTVADWRPACAALAQVPPGDDGAARAAFEAWFVPFQARNNDSETGLFTGYYEAEFEGALFPGGEYGAPLYARPDDLVTVELGLFRADLKGERLVGRVKDGRLVPYLSRADIDGGALDGRGLELLWSNDPVDVFFLQVQGSGRVRLPDG